MWIASGCVPFAVAGCGGEVEAAAFRASGDAGVDGAEECDNEQDDDGDNLVDCDDMDCVSAAACGARYGIPYETNCQDAIDDDGDGQIDCADTDCSASCKG